MQVIGGTYEKPRITLMDEDEVLAAFQMTAAEISAAGCWWGTAQLCAGQNANAACVNYRAFPPPDAGPSFSTTSSHTEANGTTPDLVAG